MDCICKRVVRLSFQENLTYFWNYVDDGINSDFWNLALDTLDVTGKGVITVISKVECGFKTYNTSNQDLREDSTSSRENKNLDLKEFKNIRKNIAPI